MIQVGDIVAVPHPWNSQIMRRGMVIHIEPCPVLLTDRYTIRFTDGGEPEKFDLDQLQKVNLDGKFQIIEGEYP